MGACTVALGVPMAVRAGPKVKFSTTWSPPAEVAVAGVRLVPPLAVNTVLSAWHDEQELPV